MEPPQSSSYNNHDHNSDSHSSLSPLRPWAMIVILGSTGTGKTALSLAVALHLRHLQYNSIAPLEPYILSADSMQLYRGVDILSAKATLEERALVPHECLDMFDDVTEDTFNVASYQSHAISVIHQREREARARGARSLPILVGGTNLYIEALLWPNLYQFNQSPSSSSSLSSLNPEGTEEQATPTVSHRHLQTWDGDSKTNEELYQELKRVDPIKANQLHPNDLRKVLRALLRARTNTPTEGKKGEKDNGDDGNDVENKGAPNGRRGGIGADGVSAIADRIVYVWVRCERGELLVERLNSRVDAMVAEGLERELKFIRQQFIARRKSMDFEKGVLQSIGIREFAQWMMTLPDDGPDNHPSFSLPDHKASSRQTAASTSPSPTPTYSLDQFNTAVSKTKSNTVRYAKKQIKWLTRHFFPTLYHQSKSVLSDVNHGRHQQSHPATVVVVDSSNSDDYKRVGLPQACATISSILLLDQHADDSGNAVELTTQPAANSLVRVISINQDLNADDEALLFGGSRWGNETHFDSSAKDGNAIPSSRRSVPTSTTSSSVQWEPMSCTYCDRLFVQQDQWVQHCASKSHKKRVGSAALNKAYRRRKTGTGEGNGESDGGGGGGGGDGDGDGSGGRVEEDQAKKESAKEHNPS